MDKLELDNIIKEHNNWLNYGRGARANFYYADLKFADLSGRDISAGCFFGTNLRGANLRYADLRYADLRLSDLWDADLFGADIEGACLENACLEGAHNIPYIPMKCPEDGSFIAWKKCRVYDSSTLMHTEYIVKLEIPEDARRSSATTNKCRCDKAKVLGIYLENGEDVGPSEIIANNHKPTLYKVGEMVYPDSFDEDRWNECSHGIHFFLNKKDAINYRLF